MSNVIKWINEKIINEGTDRIEATDIDEIRDFALLWNLFESIFCNRNANLPKIFQVVDNCVNHLVEEKYDTIFQYFYNRYKNDSDKLEALRLKGDAKSIVEHVLNDTYVDKNNKLKFIMSIIYRYRNNLFHGEKNMRYIQLQKENFKQTNAFLMYFIETCRGRI